VQAFNRSVEYRVKLRTARQFIYQTKSGYLRVTGALILNQFF